MDKRNSITTSKDKFEEQGVRRGDCPVRYQVSGSMLLAPGQTDDRRPEQTPRRETHTFLKGPSSTEELCSPRTQARDFPGQGAAAGFPLHVTHNHQPQLSYITKGGKQNVLKLTVIVRINE